MLYLIFGLGKWLKVGKQERRDTLVSEGAVIKFGDRSIDCVVRNLSATGAAIEVPNQPQIPARFELKIPRLGLNLSCRIVWRRPYRRDLHADRLWQKLGRIVCWLPLLRTPLGCGTLAIAIRFEVAGGLLEIFSVDSCLAMTCHLYIDEVGNDDVKTSSERFLSLTGIITKLHGHDHVITAEVEKLKRDLFNHDPVTNPVILHRKEIVRKEKPFEALQDPSINAEWEKRILNLIETLPYIAITVIIDKEEHLKKYQVWHFNPYHYCITALVERYVLWLNSHGLTGDVVAEPRFKQVDKKLKNAFQYIYYNGTDNIPPQTVQARLTSHELKFDPKANNVCGLQLVEMIAHPSHHNLRAAYPNQPPMTAQFGLKVVDILNRERYRRKPNTSQIEGWGTKRLP